MGSFGAFSTQSEFTMKIFIFLSLPLLISAGIAGIKLAEHKIDPKCDFVPEEQTYYCKNVLKQFPNIYYGNYNLKCIDCTFSTFDKSSFPHLNSLVAINLTNSRINRIAKDAFHSLQSVQYIHLQDNHLKHIDKGAFYGLRQVFELHLECNEISELTPFFLDGFEANNIILSNNSLKEIPPNVFEGIFGTMSLELGYNKINKLHVDSFSHLKGLEYLDLQHNKLCHVPLGAFKELRLLKELNLAHNNFKKFHHGVFSGLPNLYGLNLSHNPLVELSASLVTPLENIVRLDVSDTGLDYLDTVTVHLNAPQLKYIGLADNLWTCTVLQNIIQYLRTKHVQVMEHNRYEVTNIKGIACTEEPFTTEKIPFEFYLRVIKDQSQKMQEYC